MVSRPELGSDPPFGSGRESGRDMWTNHIESRNRGSTANADIS